SLAPGEDLGSADEHGDVRVVTARMHDAGDGRAVLDVVLLVDWQRIHVRAQGHGGSGAARELGHDTGPAHPGPYGEAQLRDVTGCSRRGPCFAEAQLGMAVNVAPEPCQLRLERG